MNKYDGGPAFPSKGKRNRPRSEIYPNATGSEVIEVDYQGMTLRDYFAAKAMQGIMSDPIEVQPYTNDELAQWAYQVADAMLKAREEE
jgi:hypothetical protein